MNISIEKKRYVFSLLKPLINSKEIIQRREGWVIKLSDDNKNYGWGEIISIGNIESKKVNLIIENLKNDYPRESLEKILDNLPKIIQFGFRCALAEIDGIINSQNRDGWKKPNSSSYLIPNNQETLEIVKALLLKNQNKNDITLKLKLACRSNLIERQLIDQIINIMPINSKIRLDANGSWDKKTALEWCNYYKKNKIIEFFEQPLPAGQMEELFELSKDFPIAIDESFQKFPSKFNKWNSFIIRRPSLEGDPIKLLEEIRKKDVKNIITTTFETGIGLRWIHHMAALQEQNNPSLKPGLALNWFPKNNLFSREPETVWRSI